MPTKNRASVELKIAVTIPTTSPRMLTWGAAGVAGIGGRIELNQIVQRVRAVGRFVSAVQPGDHPCGDRRAHPERMTDGDDSITGTQPRRVGEGRRYQVLRHHVGLDYRQILF